MTDEARTLDQLDREDGELSDFVSSAKGVFQNLVEEHFPTLDRSKLSLLMNGESKIKSFPSFASSKRYCRVDSGSCESETESILDEVDGLKLKTSRNTTKRQQSKAYRERSKVCVEYYSSAEARTGTPLKRSNKRSRIPIFYFRSGWR